LKQARSRMVGESAEDARPESWRASLNKRKAATTQELIPTNISSNDSETRLALLQAGIFIYGSAAGDKVWTRAAKILEHV
jgi:hypothetical protein